MGFYSASRRSACACEPVAVKPAPPPAPNPENFLVQRSSQVGDYLIVEVVYPDCTNWEGRKILVFEGIHPADLHRQKKLDPHFCNNPNCVTTIARFEPTDRGWRMAYSLICGLAGESQ